MSDTPEHGDLAQAEWKFIASRINDIVLHLDPQLSTSTYGDDPKLRGRLNTIYGMHIEHAQIKQVSGLMAIEGLEPSDEVVEVYQAFCNPADRGVQLVYDMVFDMKPLFLDEDEDPVRVTSELWLIFKFFRLHIGMAVAATHHEVPEWYYNPSEGVQKNDPNVNAHFASTLYTRLKLWENMGSRETPALVDELQVLVAGVNGMQMSSEEYLHLLEAEVSRREIDLVCQYLREHPQVALPRKLRDDLRGVARGAYPRGGPAEDVLNELLTLRKA